MGETEEAGACAHDAWQVRRLDAKEDLQELEEIVAKALSPIVLSEAGVDDG